MSICNCCHKNMRQIYECSNNHNICYECLYKYFQKNISYYGIYLIDCMIEGSHYKEEVVKSKRIKLALEPEETLSEILNLFHTHNAYKALPIDICPICNSKQASDIGYSQLITYLHYVYGIDVLEVQEDLIEKHKNVAGVIDYINKLPSIIRFLDCNKKEKIYDEL